MPLFLKIPVLFLKAEIIRRKKLIHFKRRLLIIEILFATQNEIICFALLF